MANAFSWQNMIILRVRLSFLIMPCKFAFEPYTSIIVQEQLTFNQPLRPKGLKMGFYSKFCEEFKIHYLVARLGASRHQRGVITLPHMFLQIYQTINICPLKALCLCL